MDTESLVKQLRRSEELAMVASVESQFKSASDVLNFLSTNDPEGYAKIIATVYDGWVSKPTTDEVT